MSYNVRGERNVFLPTQLPKMLYVCAKHFTDDCFLNLGQYRDGLAERLKIKSGSVPTLLGSATNLGQVSQLTRYNFDALLYMVNLPSLSSQPRSCVMYVQSAHGHVM